MTLRTWHGPSARFDVHYDNQAKFGLNAPLGFGPYGPGGAGIVAGASIAAAKR